MPRPREFDMDDVLEGAMNVFWDRGYADSSLEALLSAMGIAKGSVYKAFNDKHSLYLAALEHYDRTEMEKAVLLLQDDTVSDGLHRIETLFQAVIDAVVKSGDRRGCFLCNAAVDLAQADAQVKARVMSMLKRLEKALAIALEHTLTGHPLNKTEIKEQAQLLTSAYMGLRVLARAGYSPKELGEILKTHMTQLRMCLSQPASPRL